MEGQALSPTSVSHEDDETAENIVARFFKLIEDNRQHFVSPEVIKSVPLAVGS